MILATAFQELAPYAGSSVFITTVLRRLSWVLRTSAKSVSTPPCTDFDSAARTFATLPSNIATRGPRGTPHVTRSKTPPRPVTHPSAEGIVRREVATTRAFRDKA